MPDPVTRDRGVSTLIGLLVGLAVLGVLAAVAVSALPSGNSGTSLPTVPGSPTTVAGPGGLIDGAAAITCRTDYAALEQATGEYQTLHGRPATSIGQVESMLAGGLGSLPGFSFTIPAGHPGELEVSTTGHPAMAGEANCAYARG